MNISDIITKCYILALIIRDDGERLLLGDGFYEFKEQLQHFQPNTFQNDVIELQGTDGQLLAGQVRRGATQSFDGYIADSTTSREATEEHRQRFLAFFRKKHHYKVVYVFPDGSAIKRERGYIVDAPSVPEMFQRFPEFHVGLNFEDVNYYEYEEGEDGEEIFAHVQNIAIAGYVEGGLIWDNYGAVSNEITWVDYALKTTTDGYAQITDGVLGAPMNLTQLFGNTTQQSYTGKNLVSTSFHIATIVDYGENGFILTKPSTRTQALDFPTPLPAGTYTFSVNVVANTADSTIGIQPRSTNSAYTTFSIQPGQTGEITFKTTTTGEMTRIYFYILNDATDGSSITFDKIQLEVGSTATAFEPYVGGVPMPNPQFPSSVNVVTGSQTVKITGKNLAEMQNGDATESGITASRSSTTGEVILNGTSTSTATINASTLYTIHIVAGEIYTISANNAEANSSVSIRLNIRNVGSYQNFYLNTVNRTKTFTSAYTGDCTLQVRVSSGATLNNYIVKPQIELGNQASDFEPYQGQSYTIDLGSIELAKIGTYQDYIYKSGDKWYKHAEIGKVVLVGTETWNATANGNAYYVVQAGILNVPNTDVPPMMSDYYTPEPYKELYDANWDYATGVHPINARIMIRNKDCADSDALKTWLTTHNTTVYYALATPTDTAITDQGLIQELSTIKALIGETNNIWLIPSGGAQGEMEVRYSRGFINQGAGYEWDAAQGGGPNILSVDGIDRTGFVWEVVGPATNPTLTNITTNQTMTFEGDVATGQTLTVNTSDQTAEIAGTNVFAQMEGDWMQLAPGNNVITYTATGATEPSKIKWNGVVG